MMILPSRMMTAGLKVPADSHESPRGAMTGASDKRRHAPNGTRAVCAARHAVSATSSTLRWILGKRKISSRAESKNGRADPLPLSDSEDCVELLLVDSFLEFGPRSKLRDFAGGDLDGCAGLWV